MADRVLRNTAATLRVSWFESEAPASPTSVTVTVRRENGTVLDTESVAVIAGVCTYGLAPQSDLDIITLEWTGTLGGTIQTLTTEVEIVGGFICELADLRALDTISNATKYPAAKLAETRAFCEDKFERATRRTFVPRYARAVLDGNGSSTLWLRHGEARRIIGATVDGTAVVTTAWKLSPAGRVRAPSSFPTGSEVEIRYEHGARFVRGDIKAAALTYIRYLLVTGTDKINDRTLSMSADGMVSTMATAGPNRPTGLPSVDSTLIDYRAPRPSMVGGWA